MPRIPASSALPGADPARPAGAVAGSRELVDGPPPLLRTLLWALAAVAAGVLVAGFWNYRLVDGFGRDVVAGHTVGDPDALAGSFARRGAGFGFLFGAVAGVAATFTACNCVVFAMLPGLACARGPAGGSDGSRPGESAWRALAWFVGAVLLVSAAYGAFVGGLGPEGIAAFNARELRMLQARTVFTGLGLAMALWGLAELGLLDGLGSRLRPATRAFLAAPATRAAGIGLMVGLFQVGRPFPVFRAFLVYAAQADSPLYGAGVMMMQGLGQILLMVLLFAGLVAVAGKRLGQWAVARPWQPRLVGGMALLAGGAFFVFYWGLAFAFDVGRWGFKLGWYG